MTPRPDWAAHVERDLGFSFHTIAGKPYWDETACYRFSEAQIDALDDATNELEQLCLAAVERVVSEGCYDRLAIPEAARAAIERSWKMQERNIYGRFDLRYDGRDPPKLLEYNADTPTALFEAAVVQWDWLEAHWPARDQFNSIHEKLIDAWRRFGIGRRTVHFAAVKGHGEDEGTVEYLRDTAVQAGLKTERIAIEDIGWDGRQFIDLDGRTIDVLFKLYPWEWLIQEEFGAHLLSGAVKVIEPAWKLVLSNKAILAILWEMAEGHPNLLPAAFDAGAIAGRVVRKPIFGREGANVEVRDGDTVVHTMPGSYGAEGVVYQAYAGLPSFADNYPVIGSWVIASQAAGIGIREDASEITTNASRFVPHYIG
jgi:glutathionylspermidine synthase